METFIESSKPPPNGVTVPLVHTLSEFYKSLYLLGPKLQKRDRFGVHAKIETLALEALTLAITAAFEARVNKKPPLYGLRIRVEILKRLVRMCHELHLFGGKTYLDLERQLQEASKMVSGWIKFLG